MGYLGAGVGGVRERHVPGDEQNGVAERQGLGNRWPRSRVRHLLIVCVRAEVCVCGEDGGWRRVCERVAAGSGPVYVM